ncbi:MAG: type II secretion system protein [Candidatus Paceibacterota bacterium]|jgi:prepilin-type N-terminal cleavage/methylation domain-containing protein
MKKKHSVLLMRGFTLIELLVVIAIIGLLSSVVLASLNTARVKGQVAATQAQIKQYATVFELYYDAYGEYPDSGTLSYRCLGEYSDGRCWTNGIVQGTMLDNELSKVISKAPGGPMVGSHEGYIYKCAERIDDMCTKIEVRWFLNGTYQNCSGELVISNNYEGNTYCRMLR